MVIGVTNVDLNGFPHSSWIPADFPCFVVRETLPGKLTQTFNG
jgi:hypothetical protein